MARPLRISVDNGLQSWDTLLNDNLIILFDGPIPIHANASLTEANLQTNFPAASHDRCIVWVNHSVIGYTLYWSDGTTWIPMEGPRKPTRSSSVTTTQLAADVRVQFTGAGTVDFDFLTASAWTGRNVIVRNDAAAAINLDPNGSETINGGGAGVPLALPAGSTATIYSNGTSLEASIQT